MTSGQREGEIVDIAEEFEDLADEASQRDSKYANRDLKYCPGIYKPTGDYNDVWTPWFLHNKTPYATFQELCASGDVEFMFERQVKRRGIK